MATPRQPVNKANEENIDYPTVSNHELLELCKNDVRPAWNEFFRRFIPTIIDTISGILNKSRLVRHQDREDIVWDIHEKLVIKLYRDKKIEECLDADGIRGFLITTARHETIDWLRSQGYQYNLPKRDFELFLKSLDAPLKINDDGTELTFGGLIVSETLDTSSIMKKAELALSEIHGLQKEKVQWIFRLYILGILPIENEEIFEMASSNACTCSFAEAKQQIESMQLEVEKKEQKRLKANAQFLQYSIQLNITENKLKEKLKAYNPHQTKLNFNVNVKIRNDIKSLSLKKKKFEKWREEKLVESQKFSKPSRKLIASLLGIPKEKEDQISNIFARARKHIFTKLIDSPSNTSSGINN